MEEIDQIDIDISHLLQQGILTNDGSYQMEALHLMDSGSSSPLSTPDIQDDGDGEEEKSMSYLERLHAMIEECPPAIASWTNEGTTFTIYDPHALEASILPQYLQRVKFSSFVRQLNSYRFRKCRTVTGEKIEIEFSHDSFIRNRPDLLNTIQRRYRVRPSRAKVKPPTPRLTIDMRSTLSDLVASVRSLRNELNETKNILQSLDQTP